MKAAVFAACAAALCALASGAAPSANTFAQVEFVEGRASIIDAKAQPRAARVGDAILEGETVMTGADGELHARTDDHGLVALRPGTRIRVDAYVAEAGDEDKSVLSLLGGTLRSITGWIGKYRPKAYVIKTTTATIGIRGTDHEPLVIPPGDKPAAPPGIYDKVNTGSTFIENAAGRIDIQANHAGFAPHDAKTAPRVLDKVPDIYRPTKNEARIRARKEELEREMEQHRLERQKEVKERREEKAEKVEKTDKEDARKKAERKRRTPPK